MNVIGAFRDMKHGLSIDLEEWYHGEVIARRTPPEAHFPQIEQALQAVLDLLDKHDTRATFFVVGELIPEHPALIARIAGAGHEIACHTMSHTNLWDLTPEAFSGELTSFRDALAQVLPGYQPVGFRAPMFSLDRSTAWALGLLKEAGYRYDSSVFPAYTGYYGLAYAPVGVYRASLADPGRIDERDGLLELPLTVLALWKLRLPIAGGTYLRLIPYPVLRALLGLVARRRPLVLYAHPFEFYPPTPRRPLPLLERIAIYYNIPHNIGKLERLIKRFRFAPLREIVEAYERS
ncbi:MAG: polysaccharide deacetylase family protein [Dehalococcoidia bacterium]